MKYINVSLRVVDAALTTSLALQVENVQQSEVHRHTVYDPCLGILTDIITLSTLKLMNCLT